MTTSRPLRHIALGAILALSAAAASAAPSALSESEMSGVYGRGLSTPALAAFGALSSTEQGNASVSAAGDLSAALNAASLQELDRQQAQQRLQAAATGMQTTLKLAQTMSTVAQVVAPITGLAALPVLGLFGGLPALANLGALENAINTKH